MKLDYWLRRLQSLRIDRSGKTPAPHKPLLLLVILDLIECGELDTPRIRLTPELAFRFLGYWEIVATRGRSIGRVEFPFFYLKNDGILRLVTHEGLHAALASIRPTSVNLLNRVVDYAELPEDLFFLMSDPACRTAMRMTLIQCDWFLPNEKLKLCALLGIEDEGEAIDHKKSILPSSIQELSIGRDIRFRLQIVPLYGYSCLLCGVKVLLPSGIALVEAAHIHQFSQSRNDDVSNGMALCRNHHWAFDQGLWTLSTNYEVIVALNDFTEAAPNEISLRPITRRESTYHGLHWINAQVKTI